MMKQKILVSMAVAFSIMATGCGGSSSGTSTTSSSGVTLSGTMESPSSTSSSYSALVASAAHIAYLDEAPADGVDVDVYNLSNPSDDGEPIAEGTTDADGTFDIDCDGDLVDAGDLLLIIGENGIAALVTLTDDTDGATFDAGEVDFSTTLSHEAFLDELEAAGVDISDLGALDLSGVDLDFEPMCFLAMQDKQWEDADPTDDGLGANMALLQHLMAASMASGSYADLGYDSASDLMDDLLSGDASDEAVAALAEDAETLFGGSAEIYTESYDYAVQDYDVINGVYTDVFAGAVGTSAGGSADESVALEEEATLCDDMLADDDLLEQTMAVLMASDDIATLTESFGSEDALAAYYEIMQEYAVDGDYIFDSGTDDSCTDCHDWDPEAFMGVYGSLMGQAGDVELAIILSMMDSMPEFDDGSTQEFDYESWGSAMAYQYYDNPFAFDAEDSSGFWTIQVGEGFSLGEIDYETYDFYEAYNDVASSGTYDFEACITDPESCYAQYSGEEFEIAGATYTDYPADAVCGDGTCATGEESYCSFDCGYSVEETSAYGTDICGDLICGTYESYTCAADCTVDPTTPDTGGTTTPATDPASYAMTCEECTSMCETAGYTLTEGTTCADQCNTYYAGICE